VLQVKAPALEGVGSKKAFLCLTYAFGMLTRSKGGYDWSE